MAELTGNSKRYIIHDTLEVYLKERGKKDAKAYFFGWTNEGSVSRNITQEPIKSGIYNKVVAMVQTDDGMSFSTKTGVHYEEVMELQTGSVFGEDSQIKVQDIVENEDGTFTVSEKSVTGQVLDLSAKQLPRNYEVQLRSIAYDPETGEEVADVYWIFDKAMPDGNLNEVFSAGGNKTQDINFTCQVPVGSNSYGKYVVVPREDAGSTELGD